jgi:hypothetical protein
VVFSPDGTRVLTGVGCDWYGKWDETAKLWDDETAKLWDAETGQEIRTFRGHTDWVYSVVFSPDGTRVLTGSWDETAKLWDVETGQEIRTFPVGGVISVAFSPDGTRVLTGSDDGTARIWHIPDLNIAWGPDPADGATEVAKTPTLSWGPGQYATSQDVYFGDSSPPAFIGNQTETSYSPGTLDKGKTYYWRIDEVEADGTTKYEGSVWSFMVATVGR